MIACAALLIYFAFPVYVIISTALKGPGAEAGLGLPTEIDMSGFNLAWGTLKGNLWNSVQIAVPATIISCFLGALNGFVLAKTPFRGASLLFILMMVGMFIPFQAVIIPLFVFLKALALQGTLIGIIIVHIIYGLPFATLIMRNYYETIPDAIVEAASVDGCGLLRTFFQVMLPLSIPGSWWPASSSSPTSGTTSFSASSSLRRKLGLSPCGSTTCSATPASTTAP